MALQIAVRKARLKDAQIIANFVNEARPSKNPVTRTDVAERFSYVGFLIAEHQGQPVGLLGWQIENLVIRVTDFLIAPAVNRVIAGRALVSAMESEGAQLEAEAAILFLPPNPSDALLAYWKVFGYEKKSVSELARAWREAAREWRSGTQEILVKQLREDLIRKPI